MGLTGLKGGRPPPGMGLAETKRSRLRGGREMPVPPNLRPQAKSELSRLRFHSSLGKFIIPTVKKVKLRVLQVVS